MSGTVPLDADFVPSSSSRSLSTSENRLPQDASDISPPLQQLDSTTTDQGTSELSLSRQKSYGTSPTASSAQVEAEVHQQKQTSATRSKLFKIAVSGVGFLSDAYDLFIINIAMVILSARDEPELDRGRYSDAGNRKNRVTAGCVLCHFINDVIKTIAIHVIENEF
jgi:hypothetical protein